MLQSNSSIKQQHKWSDGPTTITTRIGSTQHHNNGIALTTIVQPGKNTAFKQTLADCMQSISRIQSVKLPFQHFYSREFFFPCPFLGKTKSPSLSGFFSIYNGSQSPNHRIGTGHEFPPVPVAYLNGTTPDPPIGAGPISSQQFIWVSRPPCKRQAIWTACLMELSVGPVDCCCCPIHDSYRRRARRRVERKRGRLRLESCAERGIELEEYNHGFQGFRRGQSHNFGVGLKDFGTPNTTVSPCCQSFPATDPSFLQPFSLCLLIEHSSNCVLLPTHPAP
jgi:hypothetical protein